MSGYVQIEFPKVSREQMDILIARLSLEDYVGFEETEQGLKAFIPSSLFSETIIEEIAGDQEALFNKKIISETNWNELWESNFSPVVVDEFVTVRANFHPSLQHTRHEIIITPKMSFGTGHHATTYMMIEQMQHINFIDKTVLDFGTGTGVLAILAEKLGARAVLAIDNDSWSIENAGENILVNQCQKIGLHKADTADLAQQFDIILANINKNVILDNFSLLARHLAKDGIILLSGLLKEDEDVIFRKSNEYSFHKKQTTVRDNWLCIRMSC
jgi:ribosomal protein L11 methyltransferase